jgi:single-strand DNA-binding protein
MINSIVLAGNVVKDPTSRATPMGKSVSTIRLAVNNPLNDKEVLFIDVETWGQQQEFVSKFVKKGSAVSVIGRLKLDEWMKENVKQSKYFVVADRINFIGSKKKDESSSSSDSSPQSDEFDDAAFAAAAGIKN